MRRRRGIEAAGDPPRDVPHVLDRGVFELAESAVDNPATVVLYRGPVGVVVQQKPFVIAERGAAEQRAIVAGMPFKGDRRECEMPDEGAHDGGGRRHPVAGAGQRQSVGADAVLDALDRARTGVLLSCGLQERLGQRCPGVSPAAPARSSAAAASQDSSSVSGMRQEKWLRVAGIRGSRQWGRVSVGPAVFGLPDPPARPSPASPRHAMSGHGSRARIGEPLTLIAVRGGVGTGAGAVHAALQFDYSGRGLPRCSPRAFSCARRRGGGCHWGLTMSGVCAKPLRAVRRGVGRAARRRMQR